MVVDRELLFKYFDGKLSEEAMAEVMDWASSSEENMSVFKKEHKVYDAILLSDDRLFETPVRRPVVRIMRVLRTVVAAALLVGAAFGLARLHERAARPVAMHTISVPDGQRVFVTLPDGSTLWLNSGSVLSHPSDFGRAKSREITLDGQARLSVTPDPARPFKVHTYLADVTVHGTEFDVRASAADRIFSTSLFEGSVSVSDPQGRGESVMLRPKQKISLIDGRLCVSGIDDYDVYRWTEGLYCFKDKLFPEIIEDLRRYYGMEIVYRPDPRLDKETLTGKFRISDGLDYALKVLQTSLRFKYVRDNDNNRILINP